MATIGLLPFDQFGVDQSSGSPVYLVHLERAKADTAVRVTVPIEVSQFNTSRLLFEMVTAAR